MAPAPKAAAKRPRRGGQARPISQETLQAIVQRLRARKTTLKEESQALGFATNPALRARLLKHLGSKAKYREVVSVGKRPAVKDKGTKSE